VKDEASARNHLGECDSLRLAKLRYSAVDRKRCVNLVGLKVSKEGFGSNIWFVDDSFCWKKAFESDQRVI
jgi:hypothetical protein